MRYVIVGGGVSAVCCAEELRSGDESGDITLVSASPLLKMVSNAVKLGQNIESFDISQCTTETAFPDMNIKVIRASVTKWLPENKALLLDNGNELGYDKLCIATGGRPKGSILNSRFISVRDTDTVAMLQTKLKDAKRVVIIGNGGIATEIVYELKNIEIIWAIKHSSISATFFDEGAAEFFKPMLLAGHEQKSDIITKGFKITVDKDSSKSSEEFGCALGPDWALDANITGSLKERSVIVIYNVEFSCLMMKESIDWTTVSDKNLAIGDWPIYVKLSNEQLVGCDLIIYATGVQPNSDLWKRDCQELILAEDGGIIVNDRMMSSVPNVHACGDVCTAGWTWAKHWLQMRLWTQARQMGAFCGRVMAMPDILMDFCFEFFSHVTRFFGFKVVFLGNFNGNDLQKPFKILYRITSGKEYIKLLVKDGCVQGAVLIGETEIEETIENLILDQIDISTLENDLLESLIDVDDYFD